MALTKEKLLEVLAAGGILLEDILVAAGGDDAQTVLNTKQARLDLLWTNNSPGSTFAAQTVSLTLNDYDYIVVFMSPSTSSASQLQLRDCGIALKGSTTILTMYGGTTSANNFSRAVTEVSNTGVTFGGGYLDTSANNSYAIPRKIYGGKL